jgi:hypothetical protein
MFEELIGKLVIIEFERNEARNRTIAKLLSIKDGLVELQSPTRKEIYVISVRQVIEINELPHWKIRPEMMK